MSFLFPFLNFLQPGVLWPDLAPFRPMMVASIIGLVAGLATKSGFPRRDAFLSSAFVWLCLFTLVQALSLYSRGLGVMLNELLFWAMYALFVVVSLLLIRNPADLRRYVFGMMLGGMVVVFYGIYALAAKIGLAGETGRAGAYGMYQNHNDYTFVIIQIIPFLYLYARQESGWKRYILRAFLAVCVAGILLSLSRGGILALVMEFLLLVLMTMDAKRRLLLLPVVAVAGMAVIGYQWAKRAENQQTGYTAATAQESREELWRAAAAVVKARPLFGVGSRRFGETARDYYSLSHNQVGKNTHNTFIEVVATSGLVGFSCFLAMLAGLWRLVRRPALGRMDPMLEATRVATLISFYTVLFRGLLDAKNEDWSIYVLVAIGVACKSLQRALPAAASGVPEKSLPVGRPSERQEFADRARLSRQIFNP